MSGHTAPDNFYGFQGDKLFQRRARRAFPLLVRQAQAEQPITYSDLAEELGIPNPRNMNKVLGSIRNENLRLAKAWGEEIPPIHALVCNKGTGLPGQGVFVEPSRAHRFKAATSRERRAMLRPMLEEVFAFPRWDEVLRHFGLQPVEADRKTVDRTARLPRRGGVSESPEHIELKERVARHPEWFGLPQAAGPGEIEFPFASSDRVDVLFKSKKAWVAVEVKSARSTDDDLLRGLFQCVKYRALLEATLRVEQRPLDARAVLAVEEPLAPPLIALRNALGIDVFVVNPEHSTSRPS